MPNVVGKISQGPIPRKGAGSQQLLIVGESVSLKDKALNWLSNTKPSALKTYTDKQH